MRESNARTTPGKHTASIDARSKARCDQMEETKNKIRKTQERDETSLHSNVLNNFYVYDDGGTKSLSAAQSRRAVMMNSKRRGQFIDDWFAFEEQMMNWHHSADLFTVWTPFSSERETLYPLTFSEFKVEALARLSLVYFSCICIISNAFCVRFIVQKSSLTCIAVVGEFGDDETSKKLFTRVLNKWRCERFSCFFFALPG